MADLEDMLLEVTGRTGTSRRKKQSDLHTKWQREGSSSDGSDSNNEEFSKGKHSGSHVPLKKRFEPSKNNDRTHWVNKNSDYDDYDKSSGKYSDSALSIGSDLYIDDKDKEELGKMSELNRKMIFAERSTKLDDYRLKKKARESSSMAEHSTKEIPPPLSSRSRLSVRSEKASAQIDALKELRAKRTKQLDHEGYCEFRDDKHRRRHHDEQRESSPDFEGMYASTDKRRRHHHDEPQRSLGNRPSNSAS